MSGIRIIAGQFKGKLLTLPPQDLTRPSSDRLRQAVFNILANHLSFNGIKVLDAFAGSGAYGLEALSRGAHHATFCENQNTVQKILQKNITDTLKNSNSKSRVNYDLFQLQSGKLFDLIFIDPPYDKGLENEALDYLYKNNLLAKNAIAIIEQRKGALEFNHTKFTRLPQRIYGKCQITLNLFNNC